MALAPGAKNRDVRPLPRLVGRNAVGWVELVTGRILYPWQRKVLRDLTKRNRPRRAYVQVARKNGKSFLAACLALVEACLLEQRHVYAISDSERNLNAVVMRELRDLVGGSEHLRDSIHIFQNHLEVPETGSFIQTRPNNFKATQGINPHLVIMDEVHLAAEEIWSGMQMAGAARPDGLLFGITTPGYDTTGLAHQLYTVAKAGDSALYSRIFEADTALPIDDRRAWKAANPCYARPGFAKAMELDRRSLPEHEFRRFRLGQWTATETAWLPYGAWDGLADPKTPLPGSRVWLGFDGSYSGDSTALVGCDEGGHLFIVGCWENPGRPGWRVPRDDVEATMVAAFDTWDVSQLVCDPPYWEREIGEWHERWGDRVIEFPTFSRARMAPACTSFFSAVMEKLITHDGDPRMARHIGNCVVKATPAGDVITKVDKDSPQKIDLAVAAVIALDAMRQAEPALPDFWVA